MNIEIREEAAGGAPELAQLNMALHAAHLDWRPQTFRAASVEEIETLFRQWLQEGNFRAYMALLDGRPVGYIAVRIVERPGHVLMFPRRFLDIEQICVVPGERRKGIGKALLERAKEFAQQHGISRIELNVWNENTDARHAYAAWGFKKQNERVALDLCEKIQQKEVNLVSETPRPQIPTLETDRLVLRPFVLSDAVELQPLVGAKEIASTTLNIPHPYEDGMAETWIETHQDTFEKKKGLTLAITLKENGTLFGAIGLHDINEEHEHAELGYWIAHPYWGRGYCTEAARAVLKYSFEAFTLQRIHANHFARNPASGRVMQKIGMTHEGSLRRHIKKWGVFEDIEVYGILKSEWDKGG